MYYKILDHVPASEVLAHRTIWSLVFFGLVLTFQGRLAEVAANLRRPWVVLLATAMVSANWFLFIWAIQVGRTVETSLGYFIYPLVAVILGALFFGERITKTQGAAVGLATIGVVVLTYGMGVAPWVSMILAVTFAIYSAVKKYTTAGPVVSVTAEVGLIFPFALLWLAGVHLGTSQLGGLDPSDLAGAGAFGASWTESLLLMLAGPLTAGPLIMFAYAARRVSMASIGLTLYINPMLQFAVAVLVFGEAFTIWHAMAFPLIWAALALYSLSLFWREKSFESPETAPATSSTSVT